MPDARRRYRPTPTVSVATTHINQREKKFAEIESQILGKAVR